jgi:hypothetical protein
MLEFIGALISAKSISVSTINIIVVGITISIIIGKSVVIAVVIVVVIIEWLGVVGSATEILISLFDGRLEIIVVIVGKVFGDSILL